MLVYVVELFADVGEIIELTVLIVEVVVEVAEVSVDVDDIVELVCVVLLVEVVVEVVEVSVDVDDIVELVCVALLVEVVELSVDVDEIVELVGQSKIFNSLKALELLLAPCEEKAITISGLPSSLMSDTVIVLYLYDWYPIGHASKVRSDSRTCGVEKFPLPFPKEIASPSCPIVTMSICPSQLKSALAISAGYRPAYIGLSPEKSAAGAEKYGFVI